MTDTIIDDQDLSSVHYNGSWIRGGSAHEHDQTVASSTKVGDSFTVSFYGNSISVYGTIDSTSAGVLTNYSVDNAPPEQFASQAGTGDTFNQQFWKSPALDVGHHQLLVTMVKVNDDPQPGEGTIWFDYFLVRDPTIRDPSLSKKTRIKEIVGGVVGGVVALFLCLVLFLLFLRRHRDRRRIKAQPFQSKNEIDMQPTTRFNVGAFVSDTNVGPISPFPFEPGHQNSGTMHHPSTSNTNTQSSSHGDLPRKSALLNMGHRQVSDGVYTTSTSSAPPSSTTATATATIPSSSSEPLPSDDHAISPRVTQDPLGIHSSSGVGKHQRSGSTSRIVHGTIPPPMNMSLDSAPSALSSDLFPARTPTPTPIALPTSSPTDPEGPLQHIDSGMRAINIQTEMPTTRIELPPVYSPV